jgi:hypothetical protein
VPGDDITAVGDGGSPPQAASVPTDTGRSSSSTSRSLHHTGSGNLLVLPSRPGTACTTRCAPHASYNPITHTIVKQPSVDGAAWLDMAADAGQLTSGCRRRAVSAAGRAAARGTVGALLQQQQQPVSSTGAAGSTHNSSSSSSSGGGAQRGKRGTQRVGAAR